MRALYALDVRGVGSRYRTFGILLAVATLFHVVSIDAHAQGKTRNTATKTIKATGTSTSSIRYSYFPSASTTDGRMVSLVGSGLQSMSGNAVEFGIGLPGSTDSLRIGIFDGETGGKWDLGVSELTYALYADSTASGTGITLISTFDGHDMVDNDWYSITLPLSSAAKSSDTVYFYRLVVTLNDTVSKTWSNFKLRTNGTAMFLPRAFSFAVPLFSSAEAQILYPSYPSTSTTTYDGTWTFNLSIPEPVEDIEIWDGDMDYGSADGVYRDTNDVDTPDEIPSWAENTSAVGEGNATSNDYIIVNGVRSTTVKMTGAPADDNANPWYRRAPVVEYSLEDPDGTTYRNGNPSGNLEWERFRVSTIATAASDYDYLASVLPTGNYKIKLQGMDLGNLNAWRIWYSVLGATDSATANGDADHSRKNTQGPSTTSYRSHPVLMAVDSSGAVVHAIVPSTATIGGVGSATYWNNNPSSWPIEVITLGGLTYTKASARTLFGGNSSDKARLLARQLLAAKLNVLANNSASCISTTIASAEAWLRANPVGASVHNWTTGKPLCDMLEAYNLGQLSCASSLH